MKYELKVKENNHVTVYVNGDAALYVSGAGAVIRYNYCAVTETLDYMIRRRIKDFTGHFGNDPATIRSAVLSVVRDCNVICGHQGGNSNVD